MSKIFVNSNTLKVFALITLIIIILSTFVLLGFMFIAPLKLSEGINKDNRLLFGYNEYGRFIYKHGDIRMSYGLLIPDLNRESEEDLPLVIFLNGKGTEGNDNRKQMNKCFVENLEKYGEECYALIPQCVKGYEWDNYTGKELSFTVDKLVEELLQSYKIDANRIYLSGISMGAFGVSHFINKRPDFYAAAHIVCGGNMSKEYDRWKNMPAWFVHGAKDEITPLSETVEFVNGVKNAGGRKIKLTVYPEKGHDIADEFYSMPEVWRWLFSQIREESR